MPVNDTRPLLPPEPGAPPAPAKPPADPVADAIAGKALAKFRARRATVQADGTVDETKPPIMTGEVASGIALALTGLTLYVVNKVLPYRWGISTEYPFMDGNQTAIVIAGLINIFRGWRTRD